MKQHNIPSAAPSAGIFSKTHPVTGPRPAAQFGARTTLRARASAPLSTGVQFASTPKCVCATQAAMA